MGKHSGRKERVTELQQGKETPRHTKKNFCAKLSLCAGGTVASTPSTLTSYVSGFTSIRGVRSLRTMSRLVIARQLRTGSMIRRSPKLLVHASLVTRL